MSDNYEQWSQRFMLSIGENPYASPLWDNANLDEDDISVPVPRVSDCLCAGGLVYKYSANRLGYATASWLMACFQPLVFAPSI